MKKTNISPEIEFVRLSISSVICTSGDPFYNRSGIVIADYDDDIEEAEDNDW